MSEQGDDQQPGYPQQPPPPPQYGYPPQGYGYPPQGYGYPPQGYVYERPDHPKATTALVLGIVALAGGFTCYLPLVLGPFAWVISARARREIRENPQQWGGDGKVTAGFVLGIIATILLILGIIAVVVLVGIGLSGGFDSDGGYYDDGYYDDGAYSLGRLA